MKIKTIIDEKNVFSTLWVCPVSTLVILSKNGWSKKPNSSFSQIILLMKVN